MDFFGIGNLELVVILLVALLVLGPERMLEMARTVGKFWREAQRTIRYAIDTAPTSEPKQPPAPAPHLVMQDPPQDAVARPQKGGALPEDDAPATDAGPPVDPDAAPPEEEGRQRGQ